jgi:hypothetical protein
LAGKEWAIAEVHLFRDKAEQMRRGRPRGIEKSDPNTN